MFYPRKIVSKRKETKKEIKKIKFFKIFLFFLFITITIFLTPILLYYFEISNSLPDLKEIQYDPPQSSEIFDREGNLIKVVFFSENRIF
ncbi:MAG: hypothetical protein QMD25_01555, partial [Caldisericia bacterium]|nr:hypothetical protein [Caldisericia bacterium]